MILKIARIGSDPTVIYASEELKRCMEKIDPGLDIIILSCRRKRDDIKKALYIGIDPSFSAELPEVDNPGLDDAVAIDVRNGEGYITGANPRAVLIAVFRYLRELGAAWIRPKDGEILPRADILNSCVRIKEVPSCRHRGVCIEGADSVDNVLNMIDWLPRVGMNSYFFQFRVPATFYERWYGPYLKRTDPDTALELSDIQCIRDAAVTQIKKRGLLYHASGHGWTCEPFGISGTGWDADKEHYVPEDTRQYLAEVKGKRELWGNIPLNTNLCYSNPHVRSVMGSAVAEYCRQNPEIDFVQVWLADGSNNHCECSECVKKRPSDWYIEILNEIDAKMTEEGLSAKVVFLMYCDLYWPPVETKLNNPDRFVLMFAPITRTYTKSLTEAEAYDEKKLPEYARNKCRLPRSVDENLCWLRQWQKFFSGDSFDFDYHYMWDQHKDVAHMSMNRVLFEDMKGLRNLGLNGMMSCQNQRVWLPSGFGMTAMAAALWDSSADYDKTADEYFMSAFGDDGKLVRIYLEKLSQLFCPPYFRGETEKVDRETAESIGHIPAHLDGFYPVIAKNLKESLPEAQHRSWEYLEYHARMCSILAEAAKARAEGRDDDAKSAFDSFRAFVSGTESDVQDALDVFELLGTLGWMFR